MLTLSEAAVALQRGEFTASAYADALLARAKQTAVHAAAGCTGATAGGPARSSARSSPLNGGFLEPNRAACSTAMGREESDAMAIELPRSRRTAGAGRGASSHT